MIDVKKKVPAWMGKADDQRQSEEFQFFKAQFGYFFAAGDCCKKMGLKKTRFVLDTSDKRIKAFFTMAHNTADNFSDRIEFTVYQNGAFEYTLNSVDFFSVTDGYGVCEGPHVTFKIKPDLAYLLARSNQKIAIYKRHVNAETPQDEDKEFAIFRMVDVQETPVYCTSGSLIIEFSDDSGENDDKDKKESHNKAQFFNVIEKVNGGEVETGYYVKDNMSAVKVNGVHVGCFEAFREKKGFYVRFSSRCPGKSVKFITSSDYSDRLIILDRGCIETFVYAIRESYNEVCEAEGIEPVEYTTEDEKAAVSPESDEKTAVYVDPYAGIVYNPACDYRESVERVAGDKWIRDHVVLCGCV